jgi:predicted amidohydrolase
MAAGSSDQLRIALAQIAIEHWDLEKNLAKVEAVMREHRQRADLVIFPELTLTGYRVLEGARPPAMRRDDPRLLALARASEGTSAIVGFVEESSTLEIYNSVAVLHRGAVAHVHRKISLPNYGAFEERKHFKPGRSIEHVSMGDFRIAPLICADAWSPSLPYLAAAAGANVLAISVNSPEGGLRDDRVSSREGWKQICRYSALIYGCHVAFVNRVGSEGADHVFWGESELIDPFGRLVVTSKGRNEEVLVATIEIDAVREARAVLPTMRDEDRDLVVRTLQKLEE